MRRITTATIMALALSGCSRTGTVEGDIYLVTQEGDVMRGTGARVYLVPEQVDQSLWATADTLCAQAAYQQQFSADNRRAAVRSRTSQLEEKADSLRQEAERLSPAARTQMLRHADALLVQAQESEERDLLALSSDRGRAATNWLRSRLRLFYASAAVDSAKADVDGRYVFNDVPHGTYALFALTDTRMTETDDLIGWRASAEVSGELRRQDLDNDVMLFLRAICPPGGRRVPVAGSN